MIDQKQLMKDLVSPATSDFFPPLTWKKSLACPKCSACGDVTVRDWEWFAMLKNQTSGMPYALCAVCQGRLLAGLLKQYIKVRKGRDLRGFGPSNAALLDDEVGG